MKTLIMVSILVFLVSCGQEVVVQTQYVDKEVTKEVFVAQDFEGVYYFNNGGYLELIAGSDNEITIMREGQSLQSVNPKNDTFCSHPSIYYTGLEPQNNVVKFFANVNYTDGNDVEEDISGADIRDYRRTDYKLKMISNGRIQLTITIYSDRINTNANYVVAKRVLTSI